MSDNSRSPPLSHASGAPETDNLNIQTAGPRGPALSFAVTRTRLPILRTLPSSTLRTRRSRATCATSSGSPL
jgi:hypothetical protein